MEGAHSPFALALGFIGAWATVNICFRLLVRVWKRPAETNTGCSGHPRLALSWGALRRERSQEARDSDGDVSRAIEIDRRSPSASAAPTDSPSRRAETQHVEQADPLEPKHTIELASPLHLRFTTQALNDVVVRWANCALARSALGDWFYTLGVYVAIASMVLCLLFLAAAGVQISAGIAHRLGCNVSPANAGVQGGGVLAPVLGWLTAVFSASDAATSDAQNNSTYLQALPHDTAHQQQQSRFGKRFIDAAEHHQDHGQQLLRPIIPGITLPIAHIWYYIISLAICAVAHELGHAIAAARAGIRMRRFGVFFMGIYPGAFVDLPKDKLDAAPVRHQLQVVCAGVWHNALTALVAWLLVYSGGLTRVFECSGWAKANDGVVVVDIAKSSPFYGRIPLLSTIYRVDDVALSASDANSSAAAGTGREGDRFGASPIARWTRVLTATESNHDTSKAGFCASLSEDADDGLCCEMSPRYPLGESPDDSIFCFEKYHRQHSAGNTTTASADIILRSKQRQRPVTIMRVRPSPPSSPAPMCFDLRSVLERAGPLRCQSDHDCQARESRGSGMAFGVRGGDNVCVIPSSPYPSSRVVRIYYRPPPHSAHDAEQQGEMTIYAGSLAALWLDVHVSSLMPRWQWLPYQLPSWVESLLQYILSFSLALCLLNAIPAWYLDGDHAVRLLLMAISHQQQSPDQRSSREPTANGTRPGGGSQEEDETCNLATSQAASLHKPTLPSPAESPSEQQPPTSSAARHEDDGNSVAILEPSAANQKVYVVATALTTALLAWCIAGSIVLLVV